MKNLFAQFLKAHIVYRNLYTRIVNVGRGMGWKCDGIRD
jgi:hypothetical protein